jgi:hypothetical protein
VRSRDRDADGPGSQAKVAAALKSPRIDIVHGRDEVERKVFAAIGTQPGGLESAVAGDAIGSIRKRPAKRRILTPSRLFD